jgi:protein SCO1/2
MKYLIYFGLLLGFISSCIQPVEEKDELPILGNKERVTTDMDGNPVLDTIELTITDFEFIDQDSNKVVSGLFKNKIYLVDFFFTHCPTICPTITRNMAGLYDFYENDPNILFLSHSIDVRNDTVPRLKEYAGKLGISSAKWHMVTGERDEIYRIAEEYMATADEDPNAPGGFVHSGAFILMDGKHRIRGYYDGTLEEDMLQIKADIEVLKKEMYGEAGD